MAGVDPATHTVNAVQAGTALITASYGGKQTTHHITVIAASDAVQVTSTVKTPSGVVPVLPGVVNAVYHNQTVQAQVTGSETAGLDFSTIGTVQIPVTLKISGQEFSSTISVEVVPGYGLDEIVSQLRSKLANNSYPLGNGAGNYSAAKYADFVAAVDQAEALAGNAELTEAQFNAALNTLTEAEAALLNSLNTTQNGITYKAYRDFSGDTAGKYPYGITAQDLTNGATAVVQEEAGNKFLRLTTTAVSGKANLFLPYLGEVSAAGNQRIVIEYRVRLNSNFQYANGAMVRNDSGTSNYSMVTAFDSGKILVQNGGSNKVKVRDFSLGTWYAIKMVANWDAKTYSVYINNESVPVATDFAFRHTGGSTLTGQLFGVDGYANASIDFDDFKVRVTGD